MALEPRPGRTCSVRWGSSTIWVPNERSRSNMLGGAPSTPPRAGAALPDALGVFTGAVGPTLLDPSQYDPLGHVPGTQVPKPDWAVEEYWALILRSR